MDARFVSASLLLAGCMTVTSPPPMPPRRLVTTPGPSTIPRAQDTTAPAEPPVRHERYFHWTLLADFASTVPLAYAVAYPSRYYYAAPALILTPFIHALHGEEDSGALSLVMRGAAIGGAYLISEQADCSGDEACRILVGSTMLTALFTTVVIVDTIFLARRAVRDDGWYSLPVIPSVAPAPGGATLGLSGRF